MPTQLWSWKEEAKEEEEEEAEASLIESNSPLAGGKIHLKISFTTCPSSMSSHLCSQFRSCSLLPDLTLLPNLQHRRLFKGRFGSDHLQTHIRLVALGHCRDALQHILLKAAAMRAAATRKARGA